MKIGINLLYLLPGVVGGTETYARGLLDGLARIGGEDKFDVFVNRQAETWPIPPKANFTRFVCPVDGRRRFMRVMFEQTRLPRLIAEGEIQVVHSLGYISPLLVACPSVVTVHDLNFVAIGSGMALHRRIGLNLLVRSSIRRASKVIAVSEFSRREICATFGIPKERVVAIWEGCDYLVPAHVSGMQAELLTRMRIERPYAIAFGSQSRNKNLNRLLRAFRLARERYTFPHSLVIVGHLPDWEIAEDRWERVCTTGYLAKEDLVAIFCGAEMLIFPSYYEGFGLPVLEAMSLGVPVVCSNKASIPEVAGEAAVFFDPYSIEDMAEKIGVVLEDTSLRSELTRKGHLNIRRFSWLETARETLKVYREVVS